MNRFLIVLVLIFNFFLAAIAIETDVVADNLPRDVQKTKTYTTYNYESTVRIPIKLRILNNINSENDIYEGQEIEFKTTKNVIHNGELLIPRSSIVTAKVNTIITSGMNGIPASIIFSDFKTEEIDSGKFSDSYEVFGQDRSLIVFPLKWLLTPLPPTGSLTNFIKGGHAKLKSDKTIEIYYYPFY